MRNNFNDIGSDDLMQLEKSCVLYSIFIAHVSTIRTYIRMDAYVQWNITHLVDNHAMLYASDQ